MTSLISSIRSCQILRTVWPASWRESPLMSMACHRYPARSLTFYYMSAYIKHIPVWYLVILVAVFNIRNDKILYPVIWASILLFTHSGWNLTSPRMSHRSKLWTEETGNGWMVHTAALKIISFLFGKPILYLLESEPLGLRRAKQFCELPHFISHVGSYFQHFLYFLLSRV